MSKKAYRAKQPAFGGNYVPAVTCSCGKRGYKTRTDAKAVIREMRRKGDTALYALSAYQCGSGGGLYHVGHDILRPVEP